MIYGLYLSGHWTLGVVIQNWKEHLNHWEWIEDFVKRAWEVSSRTVTKGNRGLQEHMRSQALRAQGRLNWKAFS